MQAIDEMQQAHTEHMHSMSQQLIVREQSVGTVSGYWQQSNDGLLHGTVNRSVLDCPVQICGEKQQTKQQVQ